MGDGRRMPARTARVRLVSETPRARKRLRVRAPYKPNAGYAWPTRTLQYAVANVRRAQREPSRKRVPPVPNGPHQRPWKSIQQIPSKEAAFGYTSVAAQHERNLRPE